MSFWPIVKKAVKDADIILFVVDARMPELSDNQNVQYLAHKHHKPFLRVVNKIDLVSKQRLSALQKRMPYAFFVSGTKNLGMRKLKTGILIEAKRNKLEDPLISVCGYPNMGKSAIINALAKRSKAAVSRVAGTTKGIQWVRAGNLRIADSPGVVPLEDNELKLGVLGAKNPEKLRKPDKVAMEIIKIFMEGKPEALTEKYGVVIEEDMDEYDVLLEVGKARNFLIKGGEVDENRTIIALIRDWQSGKLGF